MPESDTHQFTVATSSDSSAQTPLVQIDGGTYEVDALVEAIQKAGSFVGEGESYSKTVKPFAVGSAAPSAVKPDPLASTPRAHQTA